MQTKTLMSLVLATVLFAPAISRAEEGSEEVPDMSKVVESKGLKLTADQKAKIKAIREENKSDFSALRQKVKASREALKEKMKSDATSDELSKLFADQQADQQKLRELGFNKMLKIRDVLTPDQRTKMRGFAKDFAKEHHKRWASNKAIPSTSANVPAPAGPSK